MESDADWDLRIREILPLVAKGVKKVMDYPFSEDGDDQTPPQSGPYGDHWDVLWLGHCASLGPYDGRVYTFHDPTAPPKELEYAIVALSTPETYVREDDVRLVFEVNYSLCTYGYAVSLEGARKLRKYASTSSDAFDLTLTNLCVEHRSFRCVSVWPQVISAAYSKPTIDYDEQMQLLPPPINPYVDGPTPGPSLQISARRNSLLTAQGVSREQWIREW